MKKVSPAPSVPRTTTVSLVQPWTMTLPTILTMRSAPSIPSGCLRSTFFWASTGEESSSIAAATPVSAILAPTRHLRGPAKQIYFLPVGTGQHLDQHLVGGVTGQRVARFENCFVDRAQTRLELSDCLRRQ